MISHGVFYAGSFHAAKLHKFYDFKQQQQDNVSLIFISEIPLKR